tara:strand:+ start:5753 stop:5932 length:180 start_codon:yes stop_codon:yes gene_type:complete
VLTVFLILAQEIVRKRGVCITVTEKSRAIINLFRKDLSVFARLASPPHCAQYGARRKPI